jgi:hypothetical protein
MRGKPPGSPVVDSGVDVEVDSGAADVACVDAVASGVGVDVYSVDSDVGSGVDICWPNAVAPRITTPRATASVIMRGGPMNLEDNLVRLMTPPLSPTRHSEAFVHTVASVLRRRIPQMSEFCCSLPLLVSYYMYHRLGGVVFYIFGSMAEFERDLIRERTLAGLEAARARGRKGGPKHKLTPSQVANAKKLWKAYTPVTEICQMLKISRATFYRYVKVGYKESTSS